MTKIHEQAERDIRSFRDREAMIRDAWGDGQNWACLLSSMVPKCGTKKSASTCPAELLPRWMAELTPWINDAGTGEQWPVVIDRYASCIGRSDVMTAIAWERLMYRALGVIVREAVSHTEEAEVVAVCQTVITLCDRAANTKPVAKSEWNAARAAAESVAAVLSGSRRAATMLSGSRRAAAAAALAAAAAAAAVPVPVPVLAVAAAQASHAAALVLAGVAVSPQAKARAMYSSADRMIFAILDAWDAAIQESKAVIEMEMPPTPKESQ
jgi:hypothetical protein